ncbi:MAG: DUF2330 domain-containing protein [Halobacteriovoraceae bacterium]|nr:DUF2330 domain-containing protein [Halobacteriovoraceae bacterium]
MKLILLGLVFLLSGGEAYGFCGFFVSKADTSLFNEASKVVLVRDEDKTVITMANDFKGEAKEFAMVIPVPEVLQKGQIHVAENALIDHLDAYSSPRLVEYHDSDPCRMMMYREGIKMKKGVQSAVARGAGKKDYKVKIEAQYTVGEYDILILSAKESDGLARWLIDNKYQLPKGAKKVLGSYIKQGMKFFVAKVNLKAQSKLGFTYLRPLQMAYSSKKFMLPIRLGMLNSKGTQDLFVFALTRKGRVETINYRTVKIPSEMDIPSYLKEAGEFKKFYKDMYQTAWNREDQKAVFVEYAWDMNWCDPCAADPLSASELKNLGVFWTDAPKVNPLIPTPKRRRGGTQAQNVYLTRLHLRYDGEHFPDDLRFQVTSNRKNYQGRYIIRHPFKGALNCEAGKRYKSALEDRKQKVATNLAHLTGWKLEEIYQRMEMKRGPKDATEKKDKWWKNIWN